MFEQPSAKRVRRADLVNEPSRSTSSPPPVPLQHPAQHSPQLLHFDLEFVDISHDTATATTTQPNEALHAQQPNPNTAAAITDPVDNDPPEDEAYEFRLFSTSTTSQVAYSAAPQTQTHHLPNSGIQRINIRSPTPLSSSASGNGAFVIPYRPQSYYFTTTTTNIDPDQKAAYIDTAVSGGQIRERANKTRWPGTALPWRVIRLNATTASPLTRPVAAPAASIPVQTKTRRTRAGKKRRLAIRSKYAAAETEREKRTRRNREKKVKKKERERSKKKQAASEVNASTGTDMPTTKSIE